MLNLNDILYATTNLLSNEFEEDIFVDDQAQAFENACFFVQLLPVTSEVSTKSTNRRAVLISIDYLQETNKSIVKLNDVADRLDKIFTRKINVKDRYININDIEINLLKDDVGYRLNYLVNVSFNDDIHEDKSQSQLINNVDINLKN